jgi:ketosteroid isomerase-like protein
MAKETAMSDTNDLLIEMGDAATGRGPLKRGLSRRIAMALGLAWLFAPRTARAKDDDAVRRLARRSGDANAAFMRGDMTTWLALIGPIAEDFTLMQPFGGPPSRGFDSSPARLEELSRYFKNGETTQELVETYASDDLIVLVKIERQHGEVGGLPDQEWSLRVTQVFRRRGEEWEYVHRHADPLVRSIGLEKASDLARG